jgi:hypothetical protein
VKSEYSEPDHLNVEKIKVKNGKLKKEKTWKREGKEKVLLILLKKLK